MFDMGQHLVHIKKEPHKRNSSFFWFRDEIPLSWIYFMDHHIFSKELPSFFKTGLANLFSIWRFEPCN
jgi:hypothetical protein